MLYSFLALRARAHSGRWTAKNDCRSSKVAARLGRNSAALATTNPHRVHLQSPDVPPPREVVQSRFSLCEWHGVDGTPLYRTIDCKNTGRADVAHSTKVEEAEELSRSLGW